MGKVVVLPKNEGNGAREVCAAILGSPDQPNFDKADEFLILLWVAGFKVVPVEDEV